jgi:hypothetical protein
MARVKSDPVDVEIGCVIGPLLLSPRLKYEHDYLRMLMVQTE